MLPNDEGLNAELERMITAATPKLPAVSQNELAYSAGVEAGRHMVQRDTELKGGRNRWMWMVSHAACALAASWVTFAILPDAYRSTTPESPSSRAGNVAGLAQKDLAQKDRDNNTLPMTVHSVDGILSPRTSPSRFVEFITNRETDSLPVSNSENEPILNSRSIIF